MNFAKPLPPADHPAHLVLGLVIWSVWFVGIYAGLSVYCSRAEDASAAGIFNVLNIGLLIFTAITCIKLTVLAMLCWRRGQGFIGKVSASLYIASILATLTIAGPIFFLPPCA